jgi:serine protease Do
MRILGYALLGLLMVTGAARAADKPAEKPEKAEKAEKAADTNGALAHLDFREVIRGAKDKVFPAVVYIKCLQENMESGRKVSVEVAGSGVLISAKGEVLTNWHVVEKAADVRCLLLDGRAMDAKVVGSDKDTDLALLQLQLPKDASPLPYAALGDSDRLKEGDFVMAMGAPWGLSRSVSMGIISCARRFLPGHSQYSLWLQTDASISPGNSGGPLVNTAGEVVGVNTRGILFGGDVGFAVPSNTIRHIVSQIRTSGKVDWSWTGLQLQPLKDFDRNMYFEGNEGVIVAETDPESPARRAGLQGRDRILRIGGRPVTAMTDEDLPAVRRLLGLLPKHQGVNIDLMRGDQLVTVVLQPREKGKVEGAELDCPRWDLTAREINQFDNPDLYFYRDKGVFIYGVKEPGNAAVAGLRPMDIVVKIDGKEVTSIEAVRALHKDTVADVKSKHRIVFTVLRSGLLRQVVLDFSRDYSKE